MVLYSTQYYNSFGVYSSYSFLRCSNICLSCTYLYVIIIFPTTKIRQRSRFVFFLFLNNNSQLTGIFLPSKLKKNKQKKQNLFFSFPVLLLSYPTQVFTVLFLTCGSIPFLFSPLQAVLTHRCVSPPRQNILEFTGGGGLSTNKISS